MGFREKRAPDSNSRFRITFGQAQAAIGSRLWYVLFRPISEVQTYKQANRQTIYFYWILHYEKENN